MGHYIHFKLAAVVMGAISVALGAFGAHALKAMFSEYEIGIWQTATQYLMYHTLFVAFAATLPLSNKVSFAIKAAIAGNVMFAGSLYTLALTGNKMFGMITPLGGVCYLAAWLTLAYHFYRQLTFKPTGK